MKLLRNVVAVCLTLGMVTVVSGCSGSSSSTSDKPSKEWRTPVNISGVVDDGYNGQVVIDGEGNALAAWMSDSHVMSAAYTSNGGWEDAAITDDAVLRASTFSLAMNATGEAALAWRAEETTGDYFKARIYSVDAGWEETTENLDDRTDDGYETDVAVAQSGDMLAVWARWSPNDIMTRAYAAEAGWDDTAAAIDNSDAGSINSPRIAADGQGNAIAVWQQWDGAHISAYARFYSAEQGWAETITLLDDNNSLDVGNVSISMNETGNAVAYWTQNGAQLFARKYTNGGWDVSPTEIEDANDIYSCAGAISPDGDITFIWRRNFGEQNEVYARSYVGGVWDEDAFLLSDQDSDTSANTALISMDSAGDVLAMWSRGFDQTKIYARRFSASAGWSANIEEAFTAPAGYYASLTSLRLADDGRAVALMNYSDTSEILTSVYALTYR